MRRAPVALALATGLLAARVARAQCPSNASSCVTCHETHNARSVLRDAHPWHVDHGFGDLCAACHGGDRNATDATVAHASLRDPLADPAVSCAGCHAADAVQRAERYLAARPATPPPPARPPPAAAPPADRRHVNAVLASLASALAAAGGALWLRDRGRGTRFTPVAWARAKRWSPYAAGAGLGLLVAISEAVFGRPLAASGAFDRLAAWPARALFPRAPYYAYVMQPGLGWQVWLMVGVLLGSFASARLSGEFRARALPDTQWVQTHGPSRRKRALIAFAGAALVQFGADIAGGCTSGLAISGGALLAPGAFVFMAGMFLGGIPAAWLWNRRSP